MAFNWAGAGAGAVDGLEQIIARQMKEQDLELRREQMAGMREDRAMARQIQQQNADSAADQRRARVEETEAKRRQREAALANAQRVANDPTASEVERAFARYRMNYGEDPPAELAKFYTPPEPKPAYVPMTPEQRADEDYKNESRARASAKYRKPDSGSKTTKKYADWDTAKYGDPELPNSVQQYLTKLSMKHDNPADAQREFLGVVSGGLQGNRYLNVEKANRLLNAIYATRDPKKNMMLPAATKVMGSGEDDED